MDIGWFLTDQNHQDKKETGQGTSKAKVEVSEPLWDNTMKIFDGYWPMATEFELHQWYTWLLGEWCKD